MLPDIYSAYSSGRSLRVAFLVWNQFQVAHFAEIAKEFHEPDFIFTDRDPRALDKFDPVWLVPYGGYTRFLPDSSLHTLDGQYDVVVTQHRPPLKTPWKQTRIVMYQYSLAKPKTAYNSRWFTADHGLVYGSFSDSIIGQMCPTSRVGNARFDPYFEGRLDPHVLHSYKKKLDPSKPTLVYLPTWGDLGSSERFLPTLKAISHDFNVIVRPHHLTPLRDARPPGFTEGLLDSEAFPPVLDPGLYLMALADIVVSDMSGAIFDALYCGKPVIVLGSEREAYSNHRKADDSAIEVSRRREIGPFVTERSDFVAALQAVHRKQYASVNEKLVHECFERRGGCAVLAAEAIRRAAARTNSTKPLLQQYAAPDFVHLILSGAASKARKKHLAKTPYTDQCLGLLEPRYKLLRRLHDVSRRQGLIPRIAHVVIRASRFALRIAAAALGRLGRLETAATVHMVCIRDFGDRLASAQWLARHAENKGDWKLAEMLYQRAKALSPSARASHLRLLLKRRSFYQTGREIEAWLTLKQKFRARTLYQTCNAASALRFSRRAWKEGLAKLFRTNYAPSTTAGTELLRRFGMIRTAQALFEARNQTVPAHLADLLNELGAFADVVDVAAKNEASSSEWQMCITPSGEVIRLTDAPAASVAEVYLLLSVSRGAGNDEHRAYRSTLVAFSNTLVHSLRGLGVYVYPKIQAGIVGATPVGRHFPIAFTWHTVNCGLASQLHLKIGTLYGYFIVDTRGYGGWGSIANEPLSHLIDNIGSAEAEAHWHELSQDLIEGAKSKYAQRHDEVGNWGRYIFLPMQVADDAVAQLADVTTLDLLTTLSSWGAKSDLTVVVKRHPMCRSEEIATAIEQGQRSGSIQVSTANVHQLIKGAECVVTVNSGVGAEALLHLKPVITTGGSDYAAATTRVRSVNELRKILDSGHWHSASEDEIKRFLYFYTHHYMVHFNDTGALMNRLRCLLEPRSVPICPQQPLPPVKPATAILPLAPIGNPTSPVPKSTPPEYLGLGVECDSLLRALQARGVTCWLDSGSLLGLVRNGYLNHWEKDIDLGIWIEDLQIAREVCKEIVERFNLSYREKWTRRIPYALLLNSNERKRSRMLPIAIHVFYRREKNAWSIQPHSLVAARSKYPKYRYRELVGNRRARKSEKLRFAIRHPKYTVSILIEGINLNAIIGRRLRLIEKETSLSEKLLVTLFNEMFEWSIPARFFDDLRPLNEKYHYIHIPTQTDEYLRARYGEWRMAVQDWFYVVDDGCIHPLSEKTLKRCLREIRPQVPRLATDVGVS